MKHTAAVFYVDALQFVLVCYRTLEKSLILSRSTQTSPQRPVKATRVQVITAAPTSGTARGTARAAATRTAHNASKKPHAVDATRNDTSYALPNYTVFGRFRFVVDDRDDDDRGFR